MKKMSQEKMSSISGNGFWDGVCGAVTIARVFAAPLAITGVGLTVLGVATAGCVLGKAFQLY